MTDIASLGISIDSRSAIEAASNLDKTAAASGRAETAVSSLANESRAAMAGLSGISSAVAGFAERSSRLRASIDPLGSAMDRLNAEIREADALYRVGAIGAAQYANSMSVLESRLEATVGAQNALTAAQARGGRAAGFTASEALNLSRQMSDVGVSLAMGMNPLMVLIQQGPQVADIFGQTAARGVTLSAALRGVAASAWAAVAPFAPFIAAAALAAAALGGGLAVAAQQINKENKDLAAGLGLTEEQLKKVKNTTVTMGDVMQGVWNATSKALTAAFGPEIAKLQKFFGGLYQSAVDGAMAAIKGIVGGFLGAYGAIKATWALLPAAIGDAAITTANAVIRAIEAMINGAISLINKVINAANDAAGAAGLKIKLPTLDPVDIAELANKYAGGMAAAGTAAARGWSEGFKKGGAFVESVAASLTAEILAATRNRIISEAGAAKPQASANAAAGGAGDDRAAKADTRDESKHRWLQAQSVAAVEAAAALRAYADEVAFTADLLSQMDAQARDAAGGMASAFNGVSKSMSGVVRGIGGILTSYSGLAAREADMTARRAALAAKDKVSAEELRRFDVLASRDMAAAKVASYGDMASAAQGFFKQGSDGYKAMQVAEIAFRTIEMLNSIRAIAMKGTEVAAHVAAEGTKAGASGITAYAVTLASLPFPFNLAAGATVLAALAAMGVAISGGGGGGAASVPISERRQTGQGAGSVLGDASAKSESIARSLDIVAANTNRDLEFSNDMLKALRSIDNQIGTVAAALAQSFGVGGMLDASKLGLGTSSAGPSTLQRLFLPISNLLPGLFGSKTTRTLQDQGVQFGAGSLGEIMSGGLSGSAYQDILSTTKKKAFGITYSEKTKSSTQTTALDGDFLRQTELLIASLRDGVLAAAGTLGVVGAEATLAAFRVDLGKLSFKDMKGDEIQKALEGIFGKLADNMAGAVLPALTDLQNVGEGLFETLTRVARQYQVVDVTLASIGKTFGMVGVASLGAREQLVDLFGGLDEFTERTAFYADNFLTEAERLAPVQSAVNAELARLGLTGLKTRDQFKAVVQGLDVSTAAGANLYAALLSLAPAFAKVTEEAEAITAARDTLSTAYERESGALADTADRLADLASSLGKYRASLYSGPAAMLSPEDTYKAAKAEFDRTAGLASTGSETALTDLQGVSQAYLDASRAYYASSTGYFDDLAAVRAAVTAAEGYATEQVSTAQAQLDAMTAQVGQLIDLNENVVSVAQAIANLTALLGGTGGATPALPAPVGGFGSPAATQTAANDNAAVIAALERIEGQLSAANEQRGAVAIETLKELQAQYDVLARQLREQQA